MDTPDHPELNINRIELFGRVNGMITTHSVLDPRTKVNMAIWTASGVIIYDGEDNWQQTPNARDRMGKEITAEQIESLKLKLKKWFEQELARTS